MDDDAETYKLWRIRKTVMQVSEVMFCIETFKTLIIIVFVDRGKLKMNTLCIKTLFVYVIRALGYISYDIAVF